ncbi:hypothetical protein [Flavisolibacter ginsenosidimutans]|uniref:Uncharacterized protein n=1 Tax=Flavisolibacter ginsenosidimutans TaxID=661481 RepID=A0A5B8UKY1_9BACT|nr:hypothetical protein [Flavisolibacter ginsenosidimutans]QEC56675.1 hypothetical protein FSB75_12470 [Flavisolibacter ginsenosidimutans]
MACCGKKREDWLQKTNDANKRVDEFNTSKARSDVHFEYTGETALTVVGSLTRTRYRFNGKGDRQLIDYRDAGGMMAVPMLKKVR